MRPSLIRVLILALLPLPVLAQTPMTAAEFDAYASGKILTYARDGEVWGTEQYLPGRKVVWAFTDEECRTGYWYEAEAQICFVYENPDDPQCWLFYRGTTGISAVFASEPDLSPLAEVAESQGPMPCPGPDLGV